MCSSPRLIAAYHVLLRLLEPRHPPCALIRFKTIQILFKVSYHLLSMIAKIIDKSYSVCTTFSQYVKELCLLPDSFPLGRFANVPDLNRLIRRLSFGSHRFKELHSLLRFGSQAILCGANDFERAPPVRGGGGCRSRTDDPLLAKQVL